MTKVQSLGVTAQLLQAGNGVIRATFPWPDEFTALQQ